MHRELIAECMDASRTVLEPSNSKGGRLFPWFLCRVAGLPIAWIDRLKADHTLAGFEGLLHLEHRISVVSQEIAQQLYEAIGRVSEPKTKGTLLALRRDVYNLRALKWSRFSELEHLLPPELISNIQSFSELLLTHEQRISDLRQLFLDELLAIRKEFQSCVQQEDFENGLLLSSRALYSQLKRYSGASAGKLDKKEKQVELGLLRYFSRMVTKATPFATLCAIVPGRVSAEQDSGGRNPVFTSDPQPKWSVVRINKALYSTLVGALLRRPLVRKELKVELNPTLHEQERCWRFLAALNGREVFQRIARNEVIDFCIEIFREQSPLRLATLIEQLCSNAAIETTTEDAEKIVNKLLDIGLLRFRLGIREQEIDWDKALLDILQPIEDDHARLIARFLSAAGANLIRYSSAHASIRDEILDETNREIETLFKQLGLKPDHRHRMILYEDAGAHAQLILPQPGIDKVVNALAEFVDLTMSIAPPRADQANMRHFFDNHYGGAPVPLLQFYEDYYREHFKGHLERQWAMGQQKRGGQQGKEGEAYDFFNPFKLELIDLVKRANSEISGLIQERWQQNPSADEIVIEHDDLKRILATVPKWPVGGCSISLFADYVPASSSNGHPSLIARGYHTGYGKYFSRFLYVVPPAIRSDLYEHHSTPAEDCLAEICADSGFNGNLHPPLVGWEISYPTGESGPSQEQLLSSQLWVERDPHDAGSLIIRHQPSRKRVVPLDLGFLSPMMRPALYQLLRNFSTPNGFWLQMPEAPNPSSKPAPDAQEQHPSSKSADPGSTSILVRPRITYEGVVILARKRWQVPDSLFPKRAANEDDFDYFLRVNRWRQKVGIPRDVYMRVQPLRYTANKKQEPDKKTATRLPEVQQVEKHVESQEAQASLNEAQSNPPARGIKQRAQKAKQPSQTARRVRGDLYKPQYIDFSNPLLVNLSSKARENLESYRIFFEERVPSREQLASFDGKQFVTELIMQLDFHLELES